MAKQLTVNEALSVQKQLRERHSELVQLRNENSHNTTRRYGVGGDKDVTTVPTYDVKELDRLITRVAREQRLLEMAIKASNATTVVAGYEYDDAVLGEV